MSVEPSSEVLEGSRLTVTLGINPPISLPVTEADKELLTGGRLIGGIRVWDSWKSPPQTYELIAFAFWPGDKTDILRYSVCVADDGEAVQTGRTIRIDVNPVFAEYSVGSPSETTLRVLDKGPGAERKYRYAVRQVRNLHNRRRLRLLLLRLLPLRLIRRRLTPRHAHAHAHAYAYAYAYSDAYTPPPPPPPPRDPPPPPDPPTPTPTPPPTSTPTPEPTQTPTPRPTSTPTPTPTPYTHANSDADTYIYPYA